MSYLVEAEATGPIEGEDAIVTPPRPPHRRVSVSLLFTLTVLIGTVVLIYVQFPPRHHILMNEAVAQHRDTKSAWDLEQPTLEVVSAWANGVVGGKVPLPQGVIIGARRIEVLNRPTAVIRFKRSTEEVTYVVQVAGSVGPDTSERTDDELRAISWQTGRYRYVLVGNDKTADAWRKSVK